MILPLKTERGRKRKRKKSKDTVTQRFPLGLLLPTGSLIKACFERGKLRQGTGRGRTKEEVLAKPVKRRRWWKQVNRSATVQKGQRVARALPDLSSDGCDATLCAVR